MAAPLSPAIEADPARGPAGKHRRWLIGGMLTYLAILAAVAASLLLLHREARRRLDGALGERLAAVAVTAAYLVEGDSVQVWTLDPSESLEFLWLQTRLEQVRQQNDLAEITLCDLDQQVLISASGRLERGERNVFWDLDRDAVEIARGGFVAISRLYRSGDIYQKSAHAPIFTARGQPTAVLTVEADADFFTALGALRRGAWVTGAAVLLFLSLMGWILVRLQRAMTRYRASVQRQENLAAMGMMTTGIAHELRNPLGIIRGAAQHLGDRLHEAGIQDQTLDFIPEEVDRLDRILTGYLAFGTDSEAVPEVVDLRQPVRRTVQLIEDELAAANVRVQSAAATEALHVFADPRRLQQVLLNLLLNARDAMPNGGEVSVGLRREGSEIVLTVADQGRGLRGLSEEKIFEPFWTDKEKGSGLGLALARRIIAGQNGTLRLFERLDGPGAVAEIRLPRHAAAPDGQG